jgi:serine/threonine protein kinase
MGVVYMAEQERPVRRRVALKIIKPGMDSRQVIARFEAERQALAMMDHQNIAKVLDAGTTESGRPYFVMELVHGIPITKFCDDNRLTLRERLELFVPVCHAIQHAHQKGVIHRDIKPTNILVTMYDDKPVPKVIDFGVAKAVEQRLTEKTLFTQYGMLVGTFEYMSPEQAEMNAFGVDTRSDVYSLGVLLYELLTGTTPIEKSRLRDAALVELVRVIKEEEPPRPSVRLSTSGALPKVAAACRLQPAQLSQLVRGELDWIVMKCLEKDRSRRYETVNSLAHDIQRYLHDEPVEACPPSPFYRLKKLARKHRSLLSTAASFVGLLFVAAVVSTGLAAWAWHAERTAQLAFVSERSAREEAEAARQRAEQAAQRLRLATQLTTDGIEYYTRNNWAAAHDHFTRAMQIEPGLNTPFIYRGALYACVGLWDRAATDYEQRFQLASRANAQTWFDYVLLKAYIGDDEGCRRACQAMLVQHQETAEIMPRWHVLRSCLILQPPVGEPAELVQRAESLVAAANVPWHHGTAARANLLAGDYVKAESHGREALKLGRGAPNGVHRLNYVNLAMALFRQGKKAEANDALAQAQAAKEEWIQAMQKGAVGAMPIGWEDWLEFLVLHREAIALIKDSSAESDSRLTAIYERALAAVTEGNDYSLMDTGREHVRRRAWDEAAGAFAQVLDGLPAGFKPSSSEMKFCIEMAQTPEVFDRLVRLREQDGRLWNARGRVYANSSEWVRAAACYARSLEILRPSLPAEVNLNQANAWWGYASLKLDLAALLLLAGDEPGYRELCQSLAKKAINSSDHFVLNSLARACSLAPNAIGDPAVAVRMAENSVRQRPRLAWYLFGLGLAQHRADQEEAAIQSLKRSLEVQPAWVGRGQNFATLALACHSLGREDEARQWLAKTQSWLRESNRNAANWRFGYAASDYMNDWLGAQILLAEAEKAVGGGSKD